jgi:hypothetical protein
MLIDNWMQIFLTTTKIAEDLPYSIRGVRDSWLHSTSGHQALFWGVLAGFVGLIAALVIVHWRQQRKERIKPIVEDPDLLFDTLLAQLGLEDDDKQLLRQMASQARLKHPTVCLLSPGLLDWTRRLWQTEKGDTIAADKLHRIDVISQQLYDHVTPALAART